MIREIRLDVEDNSQAAILFGSNDANLQYIEESCGVKLVTRGEEIVINGEATAVEEVASLFEHLFAMVKRGNHLTTQDVGYILGQIRREDTGDLTKALGEVILTTVRGKPIRPKTLGQYRYIRAIRQHDIVFGIGPAGTGKTY
ncbi:MAG TPA: PhoH family protein, partial [Verrucomicrobiae bacterium]|nr:PhoH family protein [Verrucomicrobiae bacterium]